MDESDQDSTAETETVTVTEHGQVTIPERFREALGIDTPGTVAFRQTEAGEVFIERVPSASEMRGFAARSDASTDESASEVLNEKRNKDRRERDSRFSDS